MAYPPKNTGRSTPGAEYDINPKISDSRKQKLLDIKRREELKDTLISKYKSNTKHATRGKVDEEVSRFCDNAKVTEKNLAKLDRKINRNTNKSLKADGHDCSSIGAKSVSDYSVMTASSILSRRSNKSNRSNVSDKVRDGYAQNGLGVNGYNVAVPETVPENEVVAPQTGGPPQSIDEVSWDHMAQYSALLLQVDRQRQHEEKVKSQCEMRAHLDLQIQEKEMKARKVVEEDKVHCANMELELAAHIEREAEKAADSKAKLEREAKDRQEQLDYNQQKSAKQQKQKLEEEVILCQQIQTELALEAKQKAEAQRNAAVAMQKVKKENDLEKQRRLEQQKEQQRQEHALQLMCQEAQEQQDKKRADELAARTERQKKLMDKMKDSVIAAQEAQGDEDEKRAAEQRLEADQRACEIEANKRMRLKSMRAETQEYLLMQMAEKQCKKQQAQTLKALQAQIMQKDATEYKQDEQTRQQQRKHIENLNKLELDKHMQALEERKQSEAVEMTEEERRINKGLIETVYNCLQANDGNSMVSGTAAY